MEQEKIRELLGRYFDGETDEEEELFLKECLRDPALPEALREEYGYLADLTARAPEPSSGFTTRLEAVIRTDTRHHSSGGLMRIIAVTAAAAAVITGVWLTFRVAAPHPEDTYNDPLIAMTEAREILLEVSAKMNSGTSQLGQVGTIARKPDELEGMGRIGDLIGRNLSRLRYLNEQPPLPSERETN